MTFNLELTRKIDTEVLTDTVKTGIVNPQTFAVGSISAKRCVHTTDLENELDLGKVTDTLLYLKWITNKDLLYSTGNSAPCYVAAWMGEGLGAEWIPVYIWLSPFTVCLKLLQHC